MNPVRAAETNVTFELEGGTRDNDLPLERTVDDDGHPVLKSLWEPSEDERRALQNGALVRLVVWGRGHPPVALTVEGVQPS